MRRVGRCTVVVGTSVHKLIKGEGTGDGDQ